MNQETKQAMKCGARIRQVITDIVREIEYLDLRDQPQDSALQHAQTLKAVQEIKRLLQINGLCERVYPLEPFENETLRRACTRVFGVWITHEALDGKDGP